MDGRASGMDLEEEKAATLHKRERERERMRERE
jgi:hypothetical protein